MNPMSTMMPTNCFLVSKFSKALLNMVIESNSEEKILNSAMSGDSKIGGGDWMLEWLLFIIEVLAFSYYLILYLATGLLGEYSSSKST
jgi:hypothetical protein